MKVTTTDGNGNVTEYSYDPFHRLVRVTDALGNVMQSDFDKSGNVVARWTFELQPDGTYHILRESQLTYDAMNRLVRTDSLLSEDPNLCSRPQRRDTGDRLARELRVRDAFERV